MENRKEGVSLVFQKQNTMSKSKETYRLTHMLPAYTEQQWLRSYNDYLALYFATPVEKRKSHTFQQMVQLMQDIKTFLKSKGHKFF